MLTKRIIACLDVRDGVVVKGRRFAGLADAGRPAALAARYNAEGIDEVMLLDVTATRDGRRALAATVSETAASLFIPLGVGGGVRSLDDAAALFDAGADKVSLNSAALDSPQLITAIAERYGSQAVIVAIDSRRIGESEQVFGRSGTGASGRDALSWAVEAAERGAGELLLTSIDRDGTRDGFNLTLTAAVAARVSVPVIASGGAGRVEHFLDVFHAGGADAALAASVFHFGDIAVTALKRYLADHDVPVRLDRAC
jgi:cyclase